MEAAIDAAASTLVHEPRQESLPLLVEESPKRTYTTEPEPAFDLPGTPLPTELPPATIDDGAAQLLLSTVRLILKRSLPKPATEGEVARLLDVTKPQARIWLNKLVEAGDIEKLSKPVRYRTKRE